MAMNLSLELRDLKTSQTMLVPPEGLVFGREGGDADVTFRDAGISKRHARVFAQGSSWMLQDLGSSNGTWMKGQRIGDAVKLAPGDIFILNKQQLQVMAVVAPTSIGAPTEGEMPAQDEEEQQNEPTPRPAPAPKPPPGRGAPPPSGKAPSQGPAKRPAPAMLRAAPEDLPEEPEPEAHGDGGDDAMPDDTGAANAEDAAAALKSKGIGYFFIAVPKALAFYLAAVPVFAPRRCSPPRETRRSKRSRCPSSRCRFAPSGPGAIWAPKCIGSPPGEFPSRPGSASGTEAPAPPATTTTTSRSICGSTPPSAARSALPSGSAFARAPADTTKTSASRARRSRAPPRVAFCSGGLRMCSARAPSGRRTSLRGSAAGRCAPKER